MIKEIFGKKIGMTQIFGPEGRLLPVTVVEVEPACVLEKVVYANKTKLKIGCFKIKEKKISKVKKPQAGFFKKIKTSPFALIREVDMDKGADFSSEEKAKDGVDCFGAEIFQEGQKVTVRAKTKGKGFAGVIKRHHLRRQPQSHGSGMHRRTGSIGASATPSKVAKNKKMPGHLGSEFRVIKNLEILKVNKEEKTVFLKGSLPDSRKAIVKITKQQ